MAMLSVMTPVTYAMQWKEDWMSVHVVNNILVTNTADWSHNLNHLAARAHCSITYRLAKDTVLPTCTSGALQPTAP